MTDRIPHAVFVASAGTGKTHQVTELYKALILDGEQYPPEGHGLDGLSVGQICPSDLVMACNDIVMLTFARDAGAEMRTRITRKIEEKAAEENDARYWEILRSLSGATISTIHSFAQSLLKENALLAGISPAVAVLEGESTEAFLDAAEPELLECLKNADHPAHELVRQLCQARGASAVLGRMEQLYRNLISRGISLRDVDDVSSLVAEVSVPGLNELRDIHSKMQPLLEGAKGNTNAGKGFKAFTSWLDDHASADSNQILEACRVWQPLVEKDWGSKGKYPAYDNARALLRQAVGRALGREAAEHMKTFLELTRACARRYADFKFRAGLLDFDDLLLKALELLRMYPDRAPTCKVIIVDEAQDNSRVQNQVIWALKEATGASLVICGDRKQSIHTWRSADPSGMADMQARLDDPLPISLQKSFRSQDDLIEWINSISAHESVLGSQYDDQARLLPRELDEPPKGPNVELLLPDWEHDADDPEAIIEVPGKKEAEEKQRWQLTKADLKKLSESSDDVEWGDALLEHDERYAREAMAVARRIKLLVEGGEEWRPGWCWDGQSQQWVKSQKGSFRYRDVMILLRATSRQEYYESALRELGIQFTTGGKGKGFYYRQEVKDISALLSWLANERDRLSLLAVLRSPLVGFSDSAIAVFIQQARGNNKEDRDPSGSDLSRLMMSKSERADALIDALTSAGLADDVQYYVNARDLFYSLKRLAGRVPTVELVREAVRLTGYDAVLAGSFHGTQALSNLQKLLSVIQETDHSNSLSLTQMATWLSERIGEENSPDAVVSDPEDDAVRISTAHSSKGLTSRVIFIPDLRYSGMSETRACIPYDSEDGAKVSAGFEQLAEQGEVERLVTWDYAEVKEQAVNERDDETRRLFYVAITRARSLVVLSGENPSKGAAWRTWVNDWMQSMTAESLKARDRLVRRRSYSEVRAASDDSPMRKYTHITASQLAGAVDSLPRIRPVQSWRLPVTSLVKIPEAEDEEALLEYRRSSLVGLAPSWYRGHDEDLDEDPMEIDVDVSDETTTSGDTQPPVTRDAILVGTAAHDVLELLDYDALGGSRLADQLNAQGYDDDLAKAIEPRVQAVAEYLTEDILASEKVIRELPFVARFEYDGASCLVDGKIDLLYLKDGCWHVVDYKFSNSNAAKLEHTYAMQLQVYRSVLREWGKSFKLLILGCDSEGQVTPVEVAIQEDREVAEHVIRAARLVAEQLD